MSASRDPDLPRLDGRGLDMSGPVVPDPDVPEPDVPDPVALRRRVLVTGMVALVLFVALAYTVSALDLASGWLLVGLVVGYLVVVRPQKAPVRAAAALRRRLAYQAFLDQRRERDGQGAA